MNYKDGGPAFPTEKTGQLYGSDGMSLRDYFAAQALVAISSNIHVVSFDSTAVRAYKIADAMLEVRNVR